MTAYYNEFEPYAAEWLKNLIAAGLIPAGDVDTRSILEVKADDLKGYTQCHFFAGIGGWAYAARLAGWPDDRPLWTGSCPCQPFSSAGKQKGTADERHLWPVWFELIRACTPPVIMGEQVAAAIGKDWLDRVYSDLESEGYACGSAVLPACAVNAPHRRDRLWFVADADSGRTRTGHGSGSERKINQSCGSSADCALADTGRGRCSGSREGEGEQPGRTEIVWSGHGDVAHPDTDGCDQASQRGTSQERDAEPCGTLGNSKSNGRGQGYQDAGWGIEGSPSRQGAGSTCSSSSTLGDAIEPGSQGYAGDGADGGQPGRHGSEPCRSVAPAGFWDDSGWIIGADQKARRVKPGIPLLADGVSGRVSICRPAQQAGSEAQEEHWYNRIGALRAFGNAIVPQVAAVVIESYMEGGL